MIDKSADAAWFHLLQDVTLNGQDVAPRGIECREVLGYQSRIDMNYPVLTVGSRNLGRKFQAAEAAWILSGDNRVETIHPYSKAISKFSDDGVRFFGAYGPKIADQIAYVAQSIADDPDTRQAVINIWRENPRKTKDVPCTISVQFMVRNGKLYCLDTMRSSDAWLGWPYDIFNFTMLTVYLALYLRQAHGITYELGELTLTAGSQHIYGTNIDAVKDILESDYASDTVDIKPVDYLSVFSEPGDLVSWLWDRAEDGNLINLWTD